VEDLEEVEGEICHGGTEAQRDAKHGNKDEAGNYGGVGRTHFA